MAKNGGGSKKRPRAESAEIVISSQDEVCYVIFELLHSLNIVKESLATLMDLFPRKSVRYLKDRLGRWSGSLEELIDQLLTVGEAGGSDEDSDSGVVIVLDDTLDDTSNNTGADLTLLDTSVPGTLITEPVAGPSRVIPNTYIENNYFSMMSFLPEVSPAYLQEKAEEIGDNQERLQAFINSSLENKSNLPSRKDYESNQEKKLSRQKIKQLTAKDFLSEFEDPVAHYQDKTRKVSDKYKEQVRHYLQNHFPSLTPSVLNSCMENNKSLLVPCLKELASKKSKGKVRAKAKNVPRTDDLDLMFLKEYVYTKLESKILGLQESRRRKRGAEVEAARVTGGLVECSVCGDEECLVSEVIMCDQGCMFCPDCARGWVKVQIGENRASLACPMQCGSEVPMRALEEVLPQKLYSKLLENRQLEEIREAGLEDLVHCRACNYAVIMPPGSQVNVIVCGNKDCGKETCRLCGEESHIPLRCEEVEKDSEVKARTNVEQAMTEAMLRECPKCKKKYFKDEGCNKMTCECGQTMCYLCRKPVSNDYKHFYGRGSTPRKGLCPLWSNVSQVHADEMKEAANKAKKALGAGAGLLRHDPTLLIEKPKPYRPPDEHDYEDNSDDDLLEDDEDYDDDEENDSFIDDDDVDHFDDDDDVVELLAPYRNQDW